MANLNADALAKLAVRLELTTNAQILECREEAGGASADPQQLVRTLERKGYLTPFQSQKLLKGEQDGYFLGGCRLLYKIASGSFGRVFRANDPRTGKVVAVKVLRQRWTSNARSIDLFEREAKLGMSLRHPNIVQIISASRDPLSNQYYIVMEFVEGGNLRDFVSIRNRLAPAEALSIIEGAASGLAYALSTRGVTHRDMKLTNILISSQGEPKLVDFGLAGVTSSGSGAEQVDRSADYAGLEQASNVKPGDTRSDIFFLGCVFYELLTGRSPLTTTKDRLARMRKERFLKVTPIGPDEIEGPVDVIQLVERMMSLEPNRRYQSPAQVLEAIRSTRAAVAAFKDPHASVRSGAPAVCLVEKHPRLKEVVRDKFVELGYEVIVVDDALSALQQYRRDPFDALVVDAGSAGRECVSLIEQVRNEATRQSRDCASILILSENQASWAERVPEAPHLAVMVRPVTLKQLYDKLGELVPLRNGNA